MTDVPICAIAGKDALESAPQADFDAPPRHETLLGIPALEDGRDVFMG